MVVGPERPASIILLRMLPSFLDSMVELITRTSTDLPPDVREAMALALAAEPSRRRAAGRR